MSVEEVVRVSGTESLAFLAWLAVALRVLLGVVLTLVVLFPWVLLADWLVAALPVERPFAFDPPSFS
ncbi:MAG: hypothetical protein SNJ68_10995, partial [Cyanobacteriota bacterium]